MNDYYGDKNNQRDHDVTQVMKQAMLELYDGFNDTPDVARTMADGIGKAIAILFTPVPALKVPNPARVTRDCNELRDALIDELKHYEYTSKCEVCGKHDKDCAVSPVGQGTLICPDCEDEYVE